MAETLHESITAKQQQGNKAAHKNHGSIEQKRKHANPTRNQVLLAGGLVVASLGDSYVLVGLLIASSAARIQSVYQQYKKKIEQVSLNIADLQKAQMVRLLTNKQPKELYIYL